MSGINHSRLESVNHLRYRKGSRLRSAKNVRIMKILRANSESIIFSSAEILIEHKGLHLDNVDVIITHNNRANIGVYLPRHGLSKARYKYIVIYDLIVKRRVSSRHDISQPREFSQQR